MMVSITEARILLAELIRVVEKGETVVITKYGEPIAFLVKPPQGSKEVIRGKRGLIKLPE